jgi:DNA-3-methyladenine glycosylase II
MPVTRSSTRSSSKPASPVGNKKRKIISNKNLDINVTQKRSFSTQTSSFVSQAGSSNSAISQNGSGLVPAVLTFSFEDAKQHLAGVDHRFDDLFNKMECKPFEHLERVHPFR